MKPSRRAGTAAANRPSKAARAGAAVAALVAGSAFLVTTGASDVAAAPSFSAAPVRAAQTPPQDVKYYIVPPPVNGEVEFLFAIAAKTLRDGNRFPEIVALNKGRLQPDGKRLENPDVIEPGWILQLPDDASGPGVQSGPLPRVQVPATDAGFGPSGESGNARSSPAGSGSGDAALFLVGGAIVLLLAAAGLVLALVGRKRRARRPPRQRAVRPPPEAPATPPVAPVDPPTALLPPGELPEPTVAYEPVPAPAPDLAPAMVEHVSFGDDIVRVQIAAAAPGTAPVAWTPMPYDVPADGVAYVCLGVGDKGCLFVDLSRAPGPVGVGGDPAAAARVVESIAFQFSAALEPDRASVTVVGDVSMDIEFGQVERANALGQVVSRGSSLPQGAEPSLELVICSSDSARDDMALASLTSDRSRRIVPIVLGGLPNAPWSLTAGAKRRDDPIHRTPQAAGLPG